MMRLIELKDTFVGKVLAVFVSILLATSLVNVAAFATGEEGNSTTPYQESIDDRGATEASADTSSTDAAQEVTEPAQPAAQEPQAAEPATQEVVEPEPEPAPEPEPESAADPAPAKESQNNAATSSDKGSSSTESSEAAKPAQDKDQSEQAAPADATVKLKLNNASLVIKSDNNKNVVSGTPSVKVDAQKKLEFKAVAADGYTLDTVKAKSNGAEIQLTEKAGDTYVVDAANVADGLEIDVTTEVVENEEEATEEESATEEGSEEATEEETEEGSEEANNAVTLSVGIENSTVTLTNAEGEEQKVSESQDVEVAADEDLALTVEPAEDYELESVTVTDAGETSEVSGEDGVYTIPAEQVIEGSNIQVSAVTAASAQAARAATKDMNVGDETDVTCNDDGWFHSHNWRSSNTKVATVTTSGRFSQNNTQTVTAVAPGDAVITCNGEEILRVHVEVSEITVTFDPNGGQGEGFTKTTSEIENGNYRMSLPTLEESGFSRDGYTFVGWSTDKTGQNLTYTPQEITVSNGETYYAIWADDDAEDNVRAEFFLRIKGDIPYEPDANIGGGGAGYFPGGCGTGMRGSIKQGVAINNNNALVAANINEAPSDATIQAKIQEWNRTHTGENRMSYDPETQEIVWYVIKKSGDHYHVDGVIVDKAEHWVSYNPNGGSNYVPTSKQYMEGATVDVDFTAIPSKAGYTFLGWDTDSSATTPTYTEDGTNSFEMPGSSVTLYAIWQEKDAVVYTYSVDPDEGGTLSNYRDSVKPDTGEPKGSTPTANEYYEFAGWYNSDGEEITTENAAANGVKLEGDTLTPIKNDEGVFTGGSFTAKFTQVTFDGDAITVKVEKDGTPVSANGIVEATEYTAGGGTDNFNAAPDGDNLKITYTYDNLNCADIALNIDVPEGYDVDVVSDKTNDTVGEVDNSKVAKFELKGSGDSWMLDNVPGGATVTVKLTKKEFTVNYKAENGGQVDPESETVKYGENANGSTATPSEGYYFVNWTDAEGKEVSTDAKFAPQNVKEDATYTAHFAKKMEVSITGKSAIDLVYNGSKQSVSGFENETENGVSVNVDGQTYYVKGVTSTASGANAMGEAVDTEVNRDNLQVIDADGNDVTDRFTVTVNPGQFKINKRPVTFTGESATRDYTGSEIELTGVTTNDGEGTGLVSGQTSNVKASAKGTVAGTYPGTITGKDDVEITDADGNDVTANYTVTTVAGTLTITGVEGTIVITADSADKVYDGAALTDDGWTSNAEDILLEGDKLVVTVEGSATNVGDEGKNAVTSYKVMRGETDVTKSYTFGESVDGKLTINPRPVTASGSAMKTYDGTDALLEDVILTLGATSAPQSGVVNGDDISVGAIAKADAAYAKADKHEDEPLVTSNEGGLIALTGLTGEDAGNYELVEVTATGTITTQSIDPDDPSNPGVKISAPADQTYDGDYQLPEIVVTDSDGNKLIASTDGGVTGDYVVTYDNNVNATSEDSPATVTVKGINNYSGEVAQTFQIAPAKATILVNDSTKVYREKDPEDYNGYSVVLAGTELPLYTNVETKTVDTLGDIAIVREGEGTDENVDVYEDALDATVANQNANYAYTVDRGNFTITAAGGNEVKLTSQAADNTKVYDGQPLSIDATASESGSTLLFSTDGETWTTEKPSITNVGTLTIYVKATNPNFEDSAVVSATVQVTQRPVTITTDSASKVYDGTMLTNETYEVTSGSFVEGETYGVDFGDSGQLTIGQSANDATMVFAGEGNEYTAQAGNYNVTVVPGKLTVFPQSIDPEDPDPSDPDPDNPDQPFYTGATVSDPSDVYYNGSAQAWEPVVTDAQGKVLTKGADYTVSYSDDVTNVGTVTVTITGIGQYAGTVEKTYEILQVELTITTPSASKVFDGTPLTADDYNVQGLQGEDAIDVDVYGSQTEVGQSSNAFSFQISTGDRNNYKVIENPGMLTVFPQSIDPEDPDPDNPEPGDPDPSDPDPDNPDQPFYTGATVGSPTDVTYNGNDQTWAPVVTDSEGNVLTEGEDYTVSYSTDDRTNVTGTITVTITGMGDYAGSVERTYQINPAEVVVRINDQTKVAGSADPTFTSRYSGVVAGEIPGWSGGFTRDRGEAVGTYAINQGSLALADNPNGNFLASNYTLTVVPGTLTITAAPDQGGDEPTPPTPGPDTPDNPTPGPDVPGTPTPGPGTGVPTPAAGDDDATDEGDEEATEETIDDDDTPLTSGRTESTIADDSTPLASGTDTGADQHENCWVHWLMIVGIVLSGIYFAGVGVRRSRYTSDLHSYENQVLGVDDEQNPNQNAAA
ncbi:InlB B-repeat-containing protein [uncultured Slackia sp.]|uniref:InlB B-repeat-containing protein n=1 Tax=uncultured Slackia sp. TaxID=665903 RepID=UPI0025EF4526|nr:InlB B-repeat-containing protein [uncultured Slackia sp.]